MRKIIFLIHVSLDGFVSTVNGEIDWIIHDEEVGKDSYSMHERTDAAIYGRVTYGMMAGYWPQVYANPEMAEDEGSLAHARWAHDATKYVVSTTLESSDWENTVIIKENIAEEFYKIKQQPGKDLWLLGSPSLARYFMQHDLIDEYRVNVNPVILGQGQPLFGDLEGQIKLKLLNTKIFPCGVVGLHYEPVR